MKIALFGGRFDPIHNGHLAVAAEVLKTHAADEVWLSIENQHQWRPIVASAEDRKNMAELAIASVISSLANEKSQEDLSASLRDDKKEWIPVQARDDTLKGKLKVDMTPVELGGLTETIKVVRRLREKYSEYEFVFVVGSDQLPTFHKWSHWEELLKEVRFLIVARKNSPLENIPANATVISGATYEPLEDSATRIREFIKMGKSIHGLVPLKVEEYITKHKLYQ